MGVIVRRVSLRPGSTSSLHTTANWADEVVMRLFQFGIAYPGMFTLADIRFTPEAVI